MGLKEIIRKLASPLDFPILVTEELHQVLSVQGYKKKKLTALLNEFGCFSYAIQLFFPSTRDSNWILNNAGKLQTHIQIPATIQLKLVPINDAARSIERESVDTTTTEQAIRSGRQLLHNKILKLKETFAENSDAICEIFGRLQIYYPAFSTWEWYLCPSSGTTLNLHIQPVGSVNPDLFIKAQQECTTARINTINIYPYTIEIVFHAFSQIEHLPYNRLHRRKFKPY